MKLYYFNLWFTSKLQSTGEKSMTFRYQISNAVRHLLYCYEYFREELTAQKHTPIVKFMTFPTKQLSMIYDATIAIKNCEGTCLLAQMHVTK